MTWQHAALDLTRVLMVAAFVLVAAFPIRYVAAYPHAWYRSFEGRYLVLSKSAFALILALGPLVVLIPPLARWPGWPVVRVLVYLILCGVFVALNAMLSHARRAAKIQEAVREPLP